MDSRGFDKVGVLPKETHISRSYIHLMGGFKSRFLAVQCVPLCLITEKSSH